MAAGRENVRLIALCVLGLLSPARQAAAQPSLQGLSLEEAIGALEAEGLTVFYSSELVKPAMRVTVQPGGQDLREMLRAILAPHGLTIAPGPRDSVLIVAVPPTAAAAPERRPAARKSARPPVSVTPPPIDELIVAASRYELVREPGAFRLSAIDLEQLPDLGDDALRAVQRLPGAAANGFSARANVRGGDVNETLVRFDKLRLYDPFHLESFQSVFSMIDPRVVSTMEVYTGGFPTVFGDRMSGVIDVASLEPPAARYHEVAVSFFNTSALSSGEFAGGDGAWVASARRSNLDLLYNAFSMQPERPRYLDGFAKVAYRINDSLRTSANMLYSRDNIELHDDVDAEERATSVDEDRYGWLRFDHTVTEALQGNTLLAHATLSGERNGVSDKEGIGAGWLVDRRDFTIDSLQSDWSWRPRAAGQWLVQFGATFDHSRGLYDYEDEVAFELLFDADGAAREPTRAREIELAARGDHEALYGSARFRPAPRLTMDFGLRWDEQTLDTAGSGTLDPRVGIRYGFGERTFLRAGWGRFAQSQAINELPVSDGVRQFLPPQRAEHLVLGLEHTFAGGINLRVEAYDKEMSKLRPRYESLLNSLTLLPELKPDRVRILPESAVARGIELRVEQAGERLAWWGSYSRSEAMDRIAGAEAFRSWDQTHAVSAGLSLQTPQWHIGAAATYRSGWPTTAALALDEGDSVPTVITGPRNAERVSAYRSVDVRVTRTFVTQRGRLAAFLEINNSFDHNNRCCTEYQVEVDGAQTPFLELSAIDYLPRVPSLGFIWSF